MTDTLPNIKLTKNVPSDLYAETGIAVGTRIIAQNIGACDVSLSSQAGAPSLSQDAIHIIQRGEWAINDSSDAGAWAYCNSSSGLINVRIA